MVVRIHTAKVDTQQTSMETRTEAVADMTDTGLCLKVEGRGKWKEKSELRWGSEVEGGREGREKEVSRGQWKEGEKGERRK